MAESVDMTMQNNQYKLAAPDGSIYLSATPGIYGENGKLKIYGRLDCGTALASMRRFPGKYEKHRVFFADEKAALATGFRPCGNCLQQKYNEWKLDPEGYKTKIMSGE